MHRALSQPVLRRITYFAALIRCWFESNDFDSKIKVELKPEM